MRKFKLLKNYPESGIKDVGTTISFINEECLVYKKDENIPYLYTIQEVIKYPEFWEEIIEKDYEILAYINNGSKHIWKQNSELKHVFHLDNNKTFAIGLTDILELPKTYLIYSVKRLSDNIVFTVGDKIIGFNNRTNILKKIFYDEVTGITLYSDTHEGFSLKNIKHAKEKLFTTEDGIDIFEGDRFFRVWREDLKTDKYETYATKKYAFDIISKSVFHFSTKEKAEEYILYNKPCLSLNDYYSLFNEDTPDYDINEKLRNIVKSKL